MTRQAAVEAALARNDVHEAYRLLTAGDERGEAEASFELGIWFLSGRLVRRDLAASRSHFSRAADLGHERGQLIHSALLATGIGGPRKWSEALTALHRAGERSAQARKELELVGLMEIDDTGDPITRPVTELVSASPRTWWARSLLTPGECGLLREIAANFLNPAVIVDPATGAMRPDPIRTSEAAIFPWVDETPFIHAINRRIASASDTSVEQGEPLQVLHYSPGQEYRGHSDALPGVDNQRILTVLVYLNEDYEGGETSFPLAGLDLRGAIGDALIFANVNDLGQPDPDALHAGRPVTEGEKWLASRWIRERPFGRQ